MTFPWKWKPLWPWRGWWHLGNRTRWCAMTMSGLFTIWMNNWRTPWWRWKMPAPWSTRTSNGTMSKTSKLVMLQWSQMVTLNQHLFQQIQVNQLIQVIHLIQRHQKELIHQHQELQSHQLFQKYMLLRATRAMMHGPVSGATMADHIRMHHGEICPRHLLHTHPAQKPVQLPVH